MLPGNVVNDVGVLALGIVPDQSVGAIAVCPNNLPDGNNVSNNTMARPLRSSLNMEKDLNSFLLQKSNSHITSAATCG